MISSIPPNIQDIFNKTLATIIPPQNELNEYEIVIKKITKLIWNSKIPSDIQIQFIEPQGSTGIKQTALRNAADIDLFIGLNPELIFNQNFPTKKSRREFLRTYIKSLVENWLFNLMVENHAENVQISYAEHPYLSMIFSGIDIDLVICFDISEDYLRKCGPFTAVDRTPHHSRFIRDNLTLEQKNDVRLLKYFFKCHHCYGDKSPVGRSGFIGYSAEILIAYYSNLWNLFLNFQNLNHSIISLQNKTKLIQNQMNPNQNLFEELKISQYPNDYLIILDPTDPRRNVGSSISQRSYLCIRNQIDLFLQNPDMKFFTKHSLPKLENIVQSSKELIGFYFIEFQAKIDDHYTKYRDKLYSFLDSLIREASFEATLELRFEKVVGEIIFLVPELRYVIALHTSTPTLSPEYIRKGPKVGDEPHFTKFREIHPESNLVENQLLLSIKRPYTQFQDFLKDFIVNNPVKNLQMEKYGSALEDDLSPLVEESLGNLKQNVLPFIDWNEKKTFSKSRNLSKKKKKRNGHI